MTCIYCKSETPSRGREHVFPEALWQHDRKLPLGVVCDKCNGKLLRKLDNAVVANPRISYVLSEYGVPGKRGRPRERIGYFRRAENGSLDIDPPAKAVRDVRVDREQHNTFVQIDSPAEYRSDLFCRGIFKIALNILTDEAGADYVLGEEFDAVRSFVARPSSRNARLPFAQRQLVSEREPLSGKDLSQYIERPSFSRFAEGRYEAIKMRIFLDEFLVDLRHPEQVVELLDGTWPPGAEVLIHRENGTVCGRDGKAISPHVFDSPDHPMAEMLKNAKRML